jgi:hypothetical protein
MLYLKGGKQRQLIIKKIIIIITAKFIFAIIHKHQTLNGTSLTNKLLNKQAPAQNDKTTDTVHTS